MKKAIYEITTAHLRYGCDYGSYRTLARDVEKAIERIKAELDKQEVIQEVREVARLK